MSASNPPGSSAPPLGTQTNGEGSANDALHRGALRRPTPQTNFVWQLTVRNRPHHVCRALLDLDPLSLGAVVKAGVPGEVLVWMAEMTGVPMSRLCQHLGIARQTAVRKVKRAATDVFAPAESDAVVAFGLLIALMQSGAGRSADKLAASARRLGAWLEEPHADLDVTPASLMNFGIGRAIVETLLKKDIARQRV